MVPQSLLCPAEIAEIAEIWGPSQMAGFYVGRLKARNSCVPMVASDQRSSDSKFDSKLFNGPAESFMSRRNSRYSRKGAITDGEICMSHRNHGKHRKKPSQMAIYEGRLKTRNCTKFDSKLYKILSTEMIVLSRDRLLSFV